MAQTMDEMIRQARMRTAERDRGAAGAVGFRTLLARTAEIQIPTPHRLPVEYHDDSIQAPDGSLYFIPGYSAAGGGDISLPASAPSATTPPTDGEENA